MPAYAYSAAESGETKFEPLPEGDYEVTAEKVELRTLKSGKIKVSLQLRVRSDVEQEGKGRVIFDDVWKEKDNPEYFNRKRINMLLGTQDVKDGTVFDTIQDVMLALQGAHMVAHVTQEFDDFRGETINRVKWYRSSNVKPQTLGAAPAAPATSGVADIDEEDLPF